MLGGYKIHDYENVTLGLLGQLVSFSILQDDLQSHLLCCFSSLKQNDVKHR